MAVTFPKEPGIGDLFSSNNFVYQWDGEKWVSLGAIGGGVGGGGGGGATSSDLQGVTDNGSSTTNVIETSGLKLNSNELPTVSGSQGDVKRIGGLPYYHNGTSWKRFYLLDNVEDTTAVDINWNDVQVRFTFEDDGSNTLGGDQAFVNYVNNNRISPVGTAGIKRVNSPVKFDTSSLLLNQVSAYAGWVEYYKDYDCIDRSLVQESGGDWGAGKRGGCIDWTRDWTIETWAYFPTGLNTNNYLTPFICAQVGAGVGQGLVFITPLPNNDGYGNTYLTWLRGGIPGDVGATDDSLAYWEVSNDTWMHIAVSFRASDSTLHAHINGQYSTYYGDSGAVTYNNIDSNENGFTFLGMYRNGSSTYGSSPGYNIDDLRITQAFRYGENTEGGTVSDFTLPTSPFPIAPPPPGNIDTYWNNVKLRATFDTNVNDIGPDQLAGTGSGNPIISSPVKYGSGAAYPNSSQGIRWTSGDYTFLSGDWTFECWVQFNTVPEWDDGPTLAPIWSFGSNTGAASKNIEFGVKNYNSTNNTFTYYWRDADGLTELSAAADNFSRVDLERWQHIVLTKNSNNELQMFLNGYRLRNTNADQDITTGVQISAWDPNSSGEFSLGGRDGNYSFDEVYGKSTSTVEVYFDDLRFSNIVRYDDEFAPPTGPLETTGSVTSPLDPAFDGEGSLTLGSSPSWSGTVGWTVTRVVEGTYRVDFPGSFSNVGDYVVHTNLNDGPTTPCYINVDKSTSHFDVIVSQISDGAAVDTGSVAIRLVDLDDV